MSPLTRCVWPGNDPLMIDYHDTEWGVPTHDDRQHFEFLVLEAAQAGLSWSIVLRKRDGYRRAFSDFDPAKVARFTAAKIDKLTQDPSIIRNPLKIARYGNEAILYLRGVGIYSDRTSYPLPSIIIIDLTNPDGSSMALLGWIRDHARFSKVPILVLAGSNQEQEVQQAFDRGVNAFIPKCADLAELAQALLSLQLFNERPLMSPVPRFR